VKAAVLDSYALIVYLDKEPGYNKIAELFEQAVEGDRALFVCVVNWGEVLYHALRNGGEKTAKLAEDAMRALPINIVDADANLTRHAAQFKAFHKMSYADAFAAALALMNKCELVTGDKEFKQVEKQIKIHWI
jgi:uncharacterized protein